MSHALIRPSLISLLSSSFFRSVWYFLVLSSYWKSIWCLIIFLNPKVSGLPSTIASMLTPNVSSSLVFLYKRLIRLSTSAFFLSSNTIRIPSLEDSLEISTTSVVFFVSIRSTTSDINLPILAPIIVQGISVITNLSLSERFIPGSNCILPRSLILPVPLSYISNKSFLLTTSPPVGKSGPIQYCISSLVVISSLSIYAHTASTTSPRLCVGILVVIPTAIPSAPFTSRFGTLTGNTSGSFSVSSKLGT